MADTHQLANVRTERETLSAASNGDDAIVVSRLAKRYGEVVALTDVSFTVRRGTTTALLGGNGAGKTTTLSILLGVLLPTSGSIHILGEDMRKHRHRVLPRMNFTSPYVDLPKRLSVRENLVVYAKLYGVPKARSRIAELARELRLVDFLDRGYGTLSAGQRTRVSLAKALLNRPEVLLLDEPTASLDPDVGDRMRSFLEAYQRESHCTMLLATHNMGEVERMCTDVLMLRGGSIADRGSPQALLGRYGRENMEQVFLDVARKPRDDNGHGHAHAHAQGHGHGRVDEDDDRDDDAGAGADHARKRGTNTHHGGSGDKS